jgi:hypothetical protein
MIHTLHTTDIPSAVFELAEKAQEISMRQVTKKAIFNTVVIVIALAIAATDLWVVFQGQVATEYGKRLAIFILFGAGALFLVGLISLLTLCISTMAYQRLRLLIKDNETEEIGHKTIALVYATAHALQVTMPEGENRRTFLDTMRNDPGLREHPELADEVEHVLVGT